MEEKKNYISTFLKKVEFKNWGSIFKCSMKMADLEKLPKDKYGNVKVIIAKRKEADKYGNDYLMYEDTYWKEEKKDYSHIETESPF